MTIVAVALAVAWAALAVRGLLRPPRPPAPAGGGPPVVVVEPGDDVPEGDVAVAVVGPGEEPAPRALAAAAACLADPAVGAAQPSIRAASTDRLLDRLQDLEWVGLGELHLRRGQAVGALGTGPAAPVYRAEALRDLGWWPDGGAPDVRLAAALARRGWRLVPCHTAVVHRQPAPTLRALLAARVDAAGGLLRAVPDGLRLLRSQPAVARALLVPLGLLLAGALLVAAVAASVADPDRTLDLVSGWRAVAWYAVLFAPAWVAGFAYWSRHDAIGIVRAVALGHVFVVWSLHWVVAAWVALVRLPLQRSTTPRYRTSSTTS